MNFVATIMIANLIIVVDDLVCEIIVALVIAIVIVVCKIFAILAMTNIIAKSIVEFWKPDKDTK
jgi:hypothetical protein